MERLQQAIQELLIVVPLDFFEKRLLSFSGSEQ